MDYFPLFAAIKGRPCLVVGGGNVALRKVRLLRSAGADITLVAPELHDELQRLVDSQELNYVPARFEPGYADGAMLVIAATPDTTVNAAVARAAEKRRIFCNVVDDPKNSSFITPAIVDRSPIVVAISSGGAAPVLARMLREKFECILPQHLGSLAALAARWRGRVKSSLGSLTARRRFWESLFDSQVGEQLAAGQSLKAEKTSGELLRMHGQDKRRGVAGEAWLVGAGPGDPALLTLRAQQLLQRADVVLHDRLVSPEILAMARRDADFVDVGKPIPGQGCASSVQQRSTDLLIKLVSQGLRVCRLKGGDPFIFGRGGEEVTALVEAGLSYQIVPGITAASACAAYAGIPLTHRDHAQSVVFLTGHGKESIDHLDWSALAREKQTLAVYMGVSQYANLSTKLIKHGMDANTPIAIIEQGTRPSQRVLTSTLRSLPNDVPARSVKAPAILIIGSVAGYAESQQWFGQTPQTNVLPEPLYARS